MSSRHHSKQSAEAFESSSVRFSLIVPFRYSEARLDLVGRIRPLMDLVQKYQDVELIIINDGEAEDERYFDSKSLERCSVYSTGRNRESSFSLSIARNLGAQKATGTLLCFYDADLYMYEGFIDELLTEIRVQNLEQIPEAFLMLPVIYLTEEGSKKFLEDKELGTICCKQKYIHAYLSDDAGLVEKASSGTSAIVMSRSQFFRIGGYNTQFSGWGYEDYDFNLRLMSQYSLFKRPRAFSYSKSNFIKVKKYKGWKSYYRLYGDLLAQKGIYVFHGFHRQESSFDKDKKKNWKLFLKSFTRKNQATHLEDLQHGSSLVFRTNPFTFNVALRPALGKIELKKEEDFNSKEQLLGFLETYKITRVIFHNPYATEAMEQIYLWCREFDVNYVVCERGALPDSLYYDSNGFLNDGSSYDLTKWNSPLSDHQKARTTDYIDSIFETRSTLEAQPSHKKISAEIKKVLGIAGDKKVLFVPFQQPRDSVIRKYSSYAKSFVHFHTTIIELSRELVNEWVIIYKKHPAENYIDEIPNAINAEGLHTYDILQIASASLMINSGVGLYSLMLGKATYCMGDSWYCNEGLAEQVTSKDDILNKLIDCRPPDKQAVLQFICYLNEEFYSFGKMTQKKATYDDGSPITSTTKIDIYKLRGWGRYDYDRITYQEIPTSSPLFDRYGLGKVKPKTYLIRKTIQLKKMCSSIFQSNKEP